VNLLLDTHVWLWWTTGSSRLSSTARDTIADPGTRVHVSVATAWELAIKYALGKLHLPAPPSIYVRERLRTQKFHVVDVRLSHALAVEALPRHHDDPFDRILIAQAMVDTLTLMTADARMKLYPVAHVTA
jgi:PIN domain nuclease of toxin-antitoxin system